MAKSVNELLTEVLDRLVSDPDSWTTEFYAEDAHRNPVAINSAHARRYCPRGQLRRASGVAWDVQCCAYDEAVTLLNEAARHLYQCDTFDEVNDAPYLGYEAVLACFRWAIAKADAPKPLRT